MKLPGLQSCLNYSFLDMMRGLINYTPEPPREMIEKYSHLDSPYYTVDYAELDDGRWVIIEAGDGSFSGLSPEQDYEAYYRALYQCLK